MNGIFLLMVLVLHLWTFAVVYLKDLLWDRFLFLFGYITDTMFIDYYKYNLLVVCVQ